MESAGGDGVADLTFPLRRPGGETIRGQAGGLDKAGEHFDALEESVAAEHKKARAGVDGGPAEAMVGAADESINKAHELSRRAVVAGAALTDFAAAVDDFNAQVAHWNAKITQALDDNKKTKAQEIRAEHQGEFEERPVIQEAAYKASSQLKNWADDSTLKQLWNSGALPASVKDKFPEVDLKISDVDTEAGVESLVNQLINQGVLPPRARDWDAEDLQGWLKDHPGKAEELADSAPSRNAAGIESLLAGLVPPKGADEGQRQRTKRMNKVREFFESFDGDDAATLAMLFPAQTGNLNGVPFTNRAQANTINVIAADHKVQRKISELEREIDEERRDADRQNAYGKGKAIQRLQAQISEYEDRQDVYDSILDENRQLLLFDPAGDGKIAEIHGTITDDTQNVGTLVPGMGNEMDNFNKTAERAQEFQNGDPSGELTMISWLGGDMPDGITSGAASPDHYQDGMAQDLADFSQAVRQEINHSNADGNNVETTVAGHSYGGATVGAAENHGLAADNVLHISSAGLGDGIDSPEDLPESQDGVDRYSITPDDDYLMHGSRPFLHGGNPDGELTRLESGDPNNSAEASGHSGTLDKTDSVAWENALRVLTGKGDQAQEYDPEKHTPGGEYGPPKRYLSPYVGPNPYVPNR